MDLTDIKRECERNREREALQVRLTRFPEPIFLVQSAGRKLEAQALLGAHYILVSAVDIGKLLRGGLVDLLAIDSDFAVPTRRMLGIDSK